MAHGKEGLVMGTINAFDLFVIAAYMVGITTVGIWVGYRRHTTSKQYFLADKSLGWFTIGAAMFASNISTIHLVGLAASGADQGLVIGNFEWMASFCLIILGLVFAPFYFRSRITTLPEFLEKRYGVGTRAFLAFIGIMGALLIHIGLSMFAAAEVFESFLGVNKMTSIVVISAITVLYTVLGGLKAVVVTETIQTFLLLGGAVLMAVLGVHYLPQAGIHDFAAFKAALKPEQLSMIHPIRDAQGHLNSFSWLAVLLGYPILGIWYWCSDQTIVQRVLGADNQRDAQNGPLFAGFLKILPLFLMVFPGVIGYIMFKNGAIHLPQTESGPNYNMVLPEMIKTLIPQGLRGLLAAGMLAALMSTISSALNSCATLISVDIVKKLHPSIDDRRQVAIGRISTGVVMILAMLWSTQGGQFGTIFEAVNKIPMVFAPAVTTLFVLGVFWRRGTNAAALTTCAVGCGIGAVYFILDMPGIGTAILDGRARVGFEGLVTDPIQGIGIPFMLVGPIIAALCIVIFVVVSLLTPAPAADRIKNVCWEHPLAMLRGRLAGWSDPRLIASVLMVVMVVLYIVMK
jgi:SSS family solute:Na+ symporter